MFLKSVKILQNYDDESVAPFFWSTLYIDREIAQRSEAGVRCRRQTYKMCELGSTIRYKSGTGYLAVTYCLFNVLLLPFQRCLLMPIQSWQSNSSMHPYKCVALCKHISFQISRFCARSPASYMPSYGLVKNTALICNSVM